MKLLPRRGAASATDPEASDAGRAEGAEAGGDAAVPVTGGGHGPRPKGRPTPKRREATGTRGPAAPPPRTRKEAYRWQREQASRAKQAGATGGGQRLSREAYREALRQGDPSVLPRRDQGPLKALARDYVDTRIMISNFLLIAFVPIVVSPFLAAGNARAASYSQLVTFAILVVVVVEWYVTGVRLRRIARERKIPLSGSALGLGFYAGSRAYLPRRWRLPAPRKARGDAL